MEVLTVRPILGCLRARKQGDPVLETRVELHLKHGLPVLLAA